MNRPENIEQILSWPRASWSDSEAAQVAEYRAAVHRQMWKLADTAERFDRDLTEDERAEYDALDAEFKQLGS